MAERNEQYSREAYEKAEEDINEAKGRISPDAPTEELKEAVAKRGEAEERRGRLHEMAWDEALELNKQYDELYAKKDEIEAEIAEFRREKLGLGENETLEQERQEPTLEQQAQVYAEMYDVPAETILEMAKAKQAEMSEDEKKTFTMLVFTPEGKTTASAWEDIKAENPVYEWVKADGITTEGETTEAQVFFARYSQEPDEDTIGENAQNAKEREQSDKKWMSPKLRMIAGEYYRRAEGKQLDEKNWTQCPRSRSRDGGVPGLYFVTDGGKVYIYSSFPEYRFPSLGAREII